MKCLLDMDGVIVDFVGGACSYFDIDNPYSSGHHGYNDIVLRTGLTDEEFWNHLGANFWANLNPTPEWQDILEIVESRFGIDNVCLLTSPCTNVECMEGKMRWINKHMPQYSRRYLMGPCKEFCANERHWLVDDNDNNIAIFAKYGGNTCLVPRPWNSLHASMTLPYVRMVLTSQNQEP